MSEQEPFTFICRQANDTSTHVDLVSLAPADVEAHALRLLSEHLSACAVEIWRDHDLLGRIERP